MKVKDLKILDVRMYNAIIRGYVWNNIFDERGFETGNEIKELDLKDVLDLFSDKELLYMRGFGKGMLSKLKELA